MGNGKPPLLVEVEKQLLALLLRLACFETDLITEMQEFSVWLEEKMTEVINEVPDSRGWFKSDPSCEWTEANSLTMNLRRGIDSPIYCLQPPRLTSSTVAIGGGSQHDDNNLVPSDEDRMDEDGVDKDGVVEDRVNKDKVDKDGVFEDRVNEDRVDEDRVDKDQIDGERMDEDEVDEDRMDHDLSNLTISLPDEMDIDGNREDERGCHQAASGTMHEGHISRMGDLGRAAEEDDVQGQGSVAGKGDGGEDDDVEGQSTIAGQAVEENDDNKDNVAIDVVRQGSIAEENVEGISSAVDRMEGNDGASAENVEEEEDTDALGSAAEEDDDDERRGSAEQGKKQQKEEKPPVKKPSKQESKAWNHSTAGLWKETAIDVDAFFVSSLLDAFLIALFILLP